jgi:hypothetical protein
MNSYPVWTFAETETESLTDRIDAETHSKGFGQWYGAEELISSRLIIDSFADDVTRDAVDEFSNIF